MHDLSFLEMRRNIKKYCIDLPKDSVVVDIGSMYINGSYRPIVEDLGWRYCGVDLVAGRNVDVVMKSEFNTGLPKGYADVVLCGQTMEHCRNPFLLMKEIARIAKRQAMILITAPCEGWVEHRYPIDCWRFYPDGIRALFEQSGVDCVDVYIKKYTTEIREDDQEDATDCWGIGRKEEVVK